MQWISDSASSSGRIVLVTQSVLGIFYPGALTVSEIRSEIAEGRDPSSLAPQYGEVFQRSDTEYLGYAREQTSMKIYAMGGAGSVTRFVNGVSQAEFDGLVAAVLDEWGGFSFTSVEHSKTVRLIVPVFSVCTISVVAAMLLIAQERGILENSSGAGRTRAFQSAVSALILVIGDTGVWLVAALAATYPLLKIFKIMANKNPKVQILHRSDIKVSASEAVDRETSSD